MSILFQAGVFIGLSQGVYQGNIDFKELALLGDMGLGTINNIDGEMIALDGKFYCIQANGKAKEIAETTKTPFALVTHFNPSIFIDITKPITFTQLNQLIESQLPSQNIFYMLRVDCQLAYIKVRSEFPQTYPIRPLDESLKELEVIFEYENLSGTLIGTHCPTYSFPVTIPGFHFHFIDDYRKKGGHVYAANVVSGKIAIMAIREFRMQLNNSKLFDSTLLNSKALETNP